MRLSRKSIKRILTLKLGGIGDVLMTTPALLALRDAFPRAHVAMIVEAGAEAVVEGSGLVDEVVLLRTRYVAGMGAALRTVGQVARLMREVFNRYDLYVEFQNPYSLRSAIKPMLVGLASGARVRAGIDIGRRAFALNVRVPEQRFARRLQSDRYLDIVEALGIKPKRRRPFMVVPDAARAEAERLLHGLGVQASDALIAIHPGGNPDYPIRTTWPVERFAEVARQLLRRAHTKLMLTGTRRDRGICDALAARIDARIVRIDGKTSLLQLAACLERCRLCISNDTGPMHIAVAMRVPTVGIFGSGDWQSYGAYPPEDGFRMIRGHVDCWPCRDLACTTRECMKAVAVQDVLAAAEELLEEARA